VLAGGIAARRSGAAADYYMRTAVRLEKGHQAYRRVNRSLFLAAGANVGSTAQLAVYRVA
jgi:hypothetical protein